MLRLFFLLPSSLGYGLYHKQTFARACFGSRSTHFAPITNNQQVNKESLLLPILFKDYDRFNAGDITEAGMERALGGACLLPPEPTFRAIVKKFREHSRRSSSGGEVNYRAFLAAVRAFLERLEPSGPLLASSFVPERDFALRRH